MKVTVLRGISGSGKSTWVERNAPNAVVVSADHFFMKDGVYQFDPSQLAENHQRCFRLFMEAILRSEAWIVVDNTNIMAWEYAPYVQAGQAFGYEVEILTLNCSVDMSRARKDRVPPKDVERTFIALQRETMEMPRRFQSIHRLIEQC